MNAYNFLIHMCVCMFMYMHIHDRCGGSILQTLKIKKHGELITLFPIKNKQSQTQKQLLFPSF